MCIALSLGLADRIDDSSSLISQTLTVFSLLLPLAGAILGFIGGNWISDAIKRSSFFGGDETQE